MTARDIEEIRLAELQTLRAELQAAFANTAITRTLVLLIDQALEARQDMDDTDGDLEQLTDGVRELDGRVSDLESNDE